jgi:hypothetical protein
MVLFGTLFYGCESKNKTNAFLISILEQDVNSRPPGLGYSMQSAWPVLQEAYPSKSVYEITADGIDNYNWMDQTITLTSEATDSFIEYFNDCDENDLEACLTNRAFVVVYENTPIYGGIFFTKAPIAPAYHFPVIYLDLVNGVLELKIRPGNSILENYSEKEWEIIRDNRVKAFFVERGNP